MEEGSSPSQRWAAGCIAGDAIADTVIGFIAGVLMDLDEKLTRWAGANTPFFASDTAVLLARTPFMPLLDRQLPCARVLFGAMIAIILEMAGIPSLAFAVGVYLPLSSLTPIFSGGIRWLMDWFQRPALRRAGAAVSAAQFAVVSGKSPGMLMGLDEKLTRWAAVHNPFYAGPSADLLALVPFVLLSVPLCLVGREKLLAGRRR